MDFKNDLLIYGDYKYVLKRGDIVLIAHYYGEEFEEEYAEGINEDEWDTRLDLFKEHLLKAYRFGEQYSWCKILNVSNRTIIVEMPYYPIHNLHCLSKEDFSMDKLKKLIQFMEENRLYHDDLAFRNIAVDKDGNYQLIDLSSLTQYEYFKIGCDSEGHILFGNNSYLEHDIKNLNQI